MITECNKIEDVRAWMKFAVREDERFGNSDVELNYVRVGDQPKPVVGRLTAITSVTCSTCSGHGVVMNISKGIVECPACKKI